LKDYSLSITTSGIVYFKLRPGEELLAF